jgi:hypothetical protein
MTTPITPTPLDLATVLHEMYLRYNARLDDENADRQSLLEALLDDILWLSNEPTPSTQDNQGLDYSRPIDNGNPAAATPDGVELIPVNGRGHTVAVPTVEKGH